MDEIESSEAKRRERVVPVALRGARVLETFRDSLFDASNRAGMTPNEFCLQAAAEKLARSGKQFTGLFQRGDVAEGVH